MISDPSDAEAGSPEPDPVDTAWRIHAAVVDWTGKVDTKASFALAIETALLVGIFNASNTGVLSDLAGWRALWLYRIGTTLLVASVLLAMMVVRPRLRRRALDTESIVDFIYFGHLRHWAPEDLAAALASREVLPVLARQLVRMSKIAWMKHRCVQYSLGAGVLGAACIVMSVPVNA